MKNILILLFIIQIYWVSHNCYMAIDLKHLKMKNILKIPEIVQENISDLIENSDKTQETARNKHVNNMWNNSQLSFTLR